LGLPLYRLDGYQARLGVPVPDATQCDEIERVADSGYVVFAHLEALAAQGELIYQDDTAVRVLSLIAENHQAQAHAAAQGLSRSKDRTGMYTTALVSGWASGPSVSIILVGRMLGKTSRRC